MELAQLKAELLRLLREDEEFRYAAAGLLGLREVLDAIRSLQEQVARNTEAIQALQEQVRDLQAQVRDLQEQVRGLQEQMVSLQKQVARHSEVLERHSTRIEELARSIQALGARWGILAEESFRNVMKGVIERHFGGRVRRWTYYDAEGLVFGRPSLVEVDLLIRDEEHILMEVKSSISRADVLELWRVGQLYERLTGVKPRLAVVSPYVRDEARKAAEELGIEIYTSL